jgi:hypothetical protein
LHLFPFSLTEGSLFMEAHTTAEDGMEASKAFEWSHDRRTGKDKPLCILLSMVHISKKTSFPHQQIKKHPTSSLQGLRNLTIQPCYSAWFAMHKRQCIPAITFLYVLRGPYGVALQV